MKVASRGMAGRVLGPHELARSDLSPHVDPGRRTASHVGIPGDQARRVGDYHQPGLRRGIVRVVPGEDDHARPGRVNRGEARSRDIDALMEVGATADARLRRIARAAELLGDDSAPWAISESR